MRSHSLNFLLLKRPMVLARYPPVPGRGPHRVENGAMTDPEPRRLIVGITGASGAIYGIRILQALQGSGIETHLVMSDSARITLAAETDLAAADVEALADRKSVV